MRKRRATRKKYNNTVLLLLLSFVLYLALAVYSNGEKSVIAMGLVIPVITVFWFSKHWKVYWYFKKGNDRWCTFKVKQSVPLLSPMFSIPVTVTVLIAVFYIGYDYVLTKLLWYYVVVPVNFHVSNVLNSFSENSEAGILTSLITSSFSKTVLQLVRAIILYVSTIFLTASFCYHKRNTMFKKTLMASAKKGASYVNDLSWLEFENLIKEFFKTRGFKAETTALGSDGGKDLIMHKDNIRYLVQCKHWKSKTVGVATAREMIGVLESDPIAKHIYLVTSGSFSDEAVVYRQHMADRLTLIDGKELQYFLGQLKH